jgi:hypothetical protein
LAIAFIHSVTGCLTAGFLTGCFWFLCLPIHISPPLVLNLDYILQPFSRYVKRLSRFFEKICSFYKLWFFVPKRVSHSPPSGFGLRGHGAAVLEPLEVV